MCMTCGCGVPTDDHGDPANITQAMLEAAATAGGVSPSDAATNLCEVADTVYAEAGVELVYSDVIELQEGAVRPDGSTSIKIIRPGWGASGYYGAEMLAKDGPGVFTKGVKMYWDHPTKSEEAERPERSLHDLAAELTGDARYDENGPAGPGLYAEAKAFGPYKDHINELAPHIGVSIRALGRGSTGTIEGRSGKIIEGLVKAQSVDFVTTPGAGGQVMSLFEAARGGHVPPSTPPPKEEATVSEQELKEAREAVTKAEAATADALREAARSREALVLREAHDVVIGEVDKAELPDITKVRLKESLGLNPPVKEDGSIDNEKLVTSVKEAIAIEAKYIAGLTGAGKVRGMGGETTVTGGGAATIQTREAVNAERTRLFADMGLEESVAKQAAAGRD